MGAPPRYGIQGRVGAPPAAPSLTKPSPFPFPPGGRRGRDVGGDAGGDVGKGRSGGRGEGRGRGTWVTVGDVAADDGVDPAFLEVLLCVCVCARARVCVERARPPI